MNNAERIASVCVGVAAVIYGLAAQRFYPRAFGVGSREKMSLIWFGRLLFLVVGFFFIYFGLRR